MSLNFIKTRWLYIFIVTFLMHQGALAQQLAYEFTYEHKDGGVQNYECVLDDTEFETTDDTLACTLFFLQLAGRFDEKSKSIMKESYEWGRLNTAFLETGMSFPLFERIYSGYLNHVAESSENCEDDIELLDLAREINHIYQARMARPLVEDEMRTHTKPRDAFVSNHGSLLSQLEHTPQVLQMNVTGYLTQSGQVGHLSCIRHALEVTSR